MKKREQKISELETNIDRLEKEKIEIEFTLKKKNLENVKSIRIEEKERYQDQVEIQGGKLSDQTDSDKENLDIKEEAAD